MRLQSVAIVGCCVLLGLTFAGCGASHEPVSPPVATTPKETRPGADTGAIADSVPPTVSSPFHFAPVAKECGVSFTYYGNPSPEHYMTEQNGGGVAILDFDADGRMDLYFANGSHFDRPAEQAGASHAIYRCLSDGKSMQFKDVTREAGLEAFGYGMGVASGDFDNDGFTDLFVCHYGRNRLWQNNGDGTFSDITNQAGVGDEQWASSAAFADLDDDGDLDLYVSNYVEYSPEDPPCFTSHQPQPVKISCGPIGRRGQKDLLYENTGNGRFADVSEPSGVAIPETGKGLAVQIVDLDDDQRLDIYVANDTTDNFLFRNLGGLRFEEVGHVYGVAVGEDGSPQSSMGIACGDYDRNGHLDLYVTSFENSVNDFYDQIDRGVFVARNSLLGLDTTARPMLAFATLFADFDLDGWPDLFVANGHIWDLRVLGMAHQYEMTPQLYQNLQGKRFRDVSAECGTYFESKWLGRAAAVGDLDNDGDPDLVVTHELKPVEILRNDTPPAGGSVRLKLIGTTAARQPLGCRVSWMIGTIRDVASVPSGGGYQSTSDDRILMAVGDAQIIDEIQVDWSYGMREVWRNVPAASDLILVQGTGQSISMPGPTD